MSALDLQHRTTFILEGPDGGGKTYLSDLLRNYGARVDHHGPYPGRRQVATIYAESLLRSVNTLQRGPWVLERSWLSEPIYAQRVREQPSRVSVCERRWLERIALGVGAVVIYCLPPAEVCVATYRRRKTDEYLEYESQLRWVYYDYVEQLSTRSSLPHIAYDYSVGLESGEAMGEDALLLAANFAWPNLGPGMGAWRPGRSVLLVGDRPRVPRFGKAAVPFVAWNGEGCSGWLANQLEDYDIPEGELYWLNANSYFGTSENLERTRDELKPRAVATLGATAERACLEHWPRSEVLAFDHPQYHKRFHYRQEYPLLPTLRNLMKEIL